MVDLVGATVEILIASLWDQNLITLQEQFLAVYLNTQQQVIGYRFLNTGYTATCHVDVRLLVSLALHCLALTGNESLARLAMETALNSENPSLLGAVISAGADINIDLGDGWTPMHHAMDIAIDGMIQNNLETPYPEAIEMIRMLIAHGANLEQKNREGKTPLDAINTYSGSEQNFDSLVTVFREVIPSLAQRIKYQPRP